MTTETQAICQNRETEKVVKFESVDRLSAQVQDLRNNGSLWGVYYDESGNVVAEDIWGDVHPAYEA